MAASRKLTEELLRDPACLPNGADYARRLDITNHVAVSRAHVVAYSMGGDIVMKLLTRHPARLLSAVVGGSGWLRPGLQFSAVWQNRGERFAAVPVGVTFVEGFFGDRPEWWVDYRDILNRNDLRALKGLASAVGE